MICMMFLFNLSFLFASLLAFAPLPALAATISFRATPESAGVGDTVRVDVLLDSVEAVNAFSGALSYNDALLMPLAVSDGGSLVNLWVTRPTVPSSATPISFAGITPGGFFGNKGVLFSILFKATQAGTATITLDGVDILRNDGAGSEETVEIQPFVLTIASGPVRTYEEPADTTPPEPFTVYVNTDPGLFDGEWYLTFAAIDKGSGIERYAIVESRPPSFVLPLFPLAWQEVTPGPYELRDQRRLSTVYIKAIDRAGNERITTFPPQQLLTSYEGAILLGILTVLALLGLMRWGRRLKHHS